MKQVGIVFAKLDRAQAACAALDAAMGYPRVAKGKRTEVVTLTHVEPVKHPTLEQWCVPLDDRAVVHLVRILKATGLTKVTLEELDAFFPPKTLPQAELDAMAGLTRRGTPR